MDNQNTTAPLISVKGAKVALGPFTLAHQETFLTFLQDPEVAIYASNSLTIKAPFLDAEEFKKREKEGTRFTIFELEHLTMIGTTSLLAIDHHNGTATFGILIGRKEYWGKGYGTEATKLTLDYGFRFLNLHNIKLRTASFNERGQGAYIRAGFKEIGRRRKSIKLNQQRYDDILMDCIVDEFEPPVPGWIMPF